MSLIKAEMVKKEHYELCFIEFDRVDYPIPGIKDRLLVDSGAQVCVCPRNYAPECELQEVDRSLLPELQYQRSLALPTRGRTRYEGEIHGCDGLHRGRGQLATRECQRSATRKVDGAR